MQFRFAAACPAAARGAPWVQDSSSSVALLRETRDDDAAVLVTDSGRSGIAGDHEPCGPFDRFARYLAVTVDSGVKGRAGTLE